MPNHRRSARGLTLLELLLALSLSVIILAAVGMAIELQLRTLETRRTYLEEAQIARAVLRMIAADLRSAVSHEPQDFSAIESMLASIGGEALDALAEDAGGGTGQDGTGQGGTGQGGTGQGGTGQGGTGQGGTGQGGTGQSGTGQGGAGQGGSGQGEPSGDDPLLEEPSTATTDLASNVQPPPKPGLYGNTFELQVDVSRLPRLDELRYQSSSPVAAAGVMTSQIPSDVRTVTWYVQGGTMAAPLGAVPPLGAATGATTGTMAGGTGLAAPVLGDFGEITSGLVRREMGRAVTQWAISSGQSQQLQGLGELLAPEVTGLQFLYFDGYQWYQAWDSDQMGGLPLAVEITLFMQPRDSLLDEQGQVVLDPALAAQTSAGVVEGQLVYRLVVRLPNARPAPPQQGDELESLGL